MEWNSFSANESGNGILLSLEMQIHEVMQNQVYSPFDRICNQNRGGKLFN